MSRIDDWGQDQPVAEPGQAAGEEQHAGRPAIAGECSGEREKQWGDDAGDGHGQPGRPATRRPREGTIRKVADDAQHGRQPAQSVVGQHVSGQSDPEATDAARRRTPVDREDRDQHRDQVSRPPGQERQQGALQEEPDGQEQGGTQPGAAREPDRTVESGDGATRWRSEADADRLGGPGGPGSTPARSAGGVRAR